MLPTITKTTQHLSKGSDWNRPPSGLETAFTASSISVFLSSCLMRLLISPGNERMIGESMQIGNLKTGSRSPCSRLEEGGELNKGVSAGGKKNPKTTTNPS